MTAFVIRWLVTTVAVLVAAHVIPGVTYEGWGTLLGASLLLGIINALLLMLVSKIVPAFQVSGFWSAFFGAIVISLVSWLLSSFFRGSDGRIHAITHHATIKRANARVVE